MIKVGIVGAGFMGNMHLQAYQNLPDCKVVAIADLLPSKAKELGEKHKIKSYGQVDALLKDEQIELVDICLPTFLHKEYVVKAAQAGKHILCEKPMALSVADCEEMIKAARKAGIKFMIAHVIRFWPEYVRLKEIFDSKELGNLRSLTCTRLSPTPTWSWNNWLTDPKRSGGAILDLHIHDTDFILYLLGKPVSLVSKGLKTRRGWDHVFTTFTFPNGVMAFAEGGWDMSDSFPFTMAFTALFEKGVVEYNIRHEKPLAIFETGEEPQYPLVQVVEAAKDVEGNIAQLGGYFCEIEYFVDCLVNDKEPTVVTPEDAKRAVATVLLEMKSAESGKEIVLKGESVL